MGIYEVLKLRDGDKTTYGGKGVLNVVRNINQTLGPKIVGAVRCLGYGVVYELNQQMPCAKH